MKYENLPVCVPAFGDFKVLAYVSGNSKAEVIRKVKANQNVRGNGLVTIDHEDFPERVNTNKW